MSFSNYLENKLLDHVVGKTSFTMPTTYVALFTVAPNEETGTGGTEVTGGSYARVQTAGSDWNAASSGSLANAEDLQFAQASASWGTVVAFALYDASTSGNMLLSATLGSSKPVDTGDTVRFAAGDLTITLD